MIDPGETLPLSDEEKRLLDKTPNANRETRLQSLLAELETQSASTADGQLKQAQTALEIAGIQLDLDLKNEAWQHARGPDGKHIDAHHR